MTTGAEVIAAARADAAAAREIAKRVMRRSRCPWIDVALAEGWSLSLEGLFRSAAREMVRKTGSVPPLAWFDNFRFKPEDAAYFKTHGEAHMAFELHEIAAERAALPKAPSVSDRITGGRVE